MTCEMEEVRDLLDSTGNMIVDRPMDSHCTSEIINEEPNSIQVETAVANDTLLANRIGLNEIIAVCQDEVRNAKCYVASSRPWPRIVRCRQGEDTPSNATCISRPAGTGVDFTVPVVIKEYYEVVKNPIFLDSILEKCQANLYSSPDEFMVDMRLLLCSMVTLNRGTPSELVVNHAELLFECAEDAIASRKETIQGLMNPMSQGINKLIRSTTSTLTPVPGSEMILKLPMAPS